MVLGEHQKWKGAGPTRRSTQKKDEMMYVPVLKTIQHLFKDDNFIAEVSYRSNQYTHMLAKMLISKLNELYFHSLDREWSLLKG